MDPFHIKTPLIQSQNLNRALGKRIHFKLELLQPSRSFKLRGIGKLCQHQWQQGVKYFVASSGGNAGATVAYCGQQLGVPTTIFIPSTSHPLYIDAIKSFGAQVIVAGDVWDEAHQAAEAFALEKRAAYIPPFDHPMLWDGYATMIEEVVEEGIEAPDAVILSVGGGGLACGALNGMHQQGWFDTPLICVETIGADAFFQSAKANRLVKLPAITSKATSLGAKQITNKLMEWQSVHPVKNVVVSDESAEQGSYAFANDLGLLAETSSGAALSIVYGNHEVIDEYSNILVIACGGLNTSHLIPSECA